MHKFFVPKENINNEKAIILGEDVKHIYKVLRLKKEDEVIINNCEGEEFLGEISYIDKKEVIVNIKKKLDINNESFIQIYLFQGMPKTSKMDLIVQKNCELGVREITPIITERVVVKQYGGQYKKLDRLEKIAIESSKQCKRTFIPKVNNPIEFEELLEKLKTMDLIVVPYENQQGFGMRNLINNIEKNKIIKIGVVIGPEGGFEEEEIVELKNVGANIITLGPRILRTETAGFVTTSLLMYELGDLGGND
ncbi:16S rRNA (uracil(1498)-N(3))-methyltransferase [Clostridium cochlearium]|uniref:Ribosomal RNA small subunit methyltransferase E n=1 Tax=Clostridium cochlearium TaxID=1494 RepID=A0A7Y3XYD4_CLOCO|nr:16S rRNA (uracil(1498)-N(3))-methyltransferase [Clostridium cochlearium]NOH15727.1 16S rRNA (uracil(1498)-N(3))-methyltransferase [Clostridium cochlearium]